MDSKKVRDLMHSLDEYATISDNCTIREALVALDKAQLGLTPDRHHHRAVLVLDGSGNVVGKLTHWAILRSLEPGPLQNEDLASLDRAGLSAEFVHRLIDPYDPGWLLVDAGGIRDLAPESCALITKK